VNREDSSSNAVPPEAQRSDTGPTVAFDRRRFLLVAASLATVGTAGVTGCSASDGDHGSEAEVQGAGAVPEVEGLEAVIAFGRARLSDDPSAGGPDPRTTLDELLGGGVASELEGSERASWTPDADALANLRQRINADYDAMDIVEVDGWVISATEASFTAAVATLLDPP